MIKQKKIKIKYPLNSSEKQRFRHRLEEVLNQKDGEQIIILWDKNKLTDYYQNICIKHLLKEIKDSAIDYAEETKNTLIENNL